MTFWIWGSVNPRPTDYIFTAFFPSGYNTFFLNSILLGLTGFIYILAIWLYRHYSNEDKRNKADFYAELGVGFIIGMLNMVLATLLAIGWTFKSASYSKQIIKLTPNEIKIESTPKNLRNKLIIARFVFFLSFLLILSTAAGIFWLWYDRYYPYLAFYLAGYVIMIILTIIKKVPRLIFYNKSWQLAPESRKRLKILIFCFLILHIGVFLGSTLLKYHPEAPAEPTSDAITDLKVMSFNIRYGTANENNPLDNWANRREPLAKYLDGMELDIIGLQEALLFQIDYIKANLKSANYAYTGFGREDAVHGGEHAAIFFNSDKFNFIDGDTFWLSDTPDYPSRTWGNGNFRVCTWARFEVKETGAQFCIFNTHYDFSDEFHIKASNLINARIVKHTGGLPVLLMGDFNMRSSNQGYAILVNKEPKPLFDTFIAYHNGSEPFEYTGSKWDPTYVPPNPSRIDFIFGTSAIQVKSCVIPKDSYGDSRTYSDHYPVVLECKF
jgi:endonuclease/exonuclease/phosphatase family metal-dependent hydrolase